MSDDVKDDVQEGGFTKEEEFTMTKILAAIVGLFSEGNSFNDVAATHLSTIPQPVLKTFLDSLCENFADDGYAPYGDILMRYNADHDFRLSDFHEDYQKMIKWILNELAHDILETTGYTFDQVMASASKMVN